jgi:hypothetical protein
MPHDEHLMVGRNADSLSPDMAAIRHFRVVVQMCYSRVKENIGYADIDTRYRSNRCRAWLAQDGGQPVGVI